MLDWPHAHTPRMTASSTRLLFACLLLTALPGLARAGITLHVEGLEPALEKAVVSSVQLSQYADREVSAAQVKHLFAAAPAQAQAALQPYGYFDATVQGKIQAQGKDWIVTLTVTPGAPVKVTDVSIDVPAPAVKLPAVHWAIRRFQPAKGQVLDQGKYTASRDAINSALIANGFLDARMTRHRVAVRARDHSAHVQLAWDTGPRYRLGKVIFSGSQLEPGFLKRYVPWQPGDYYQQNQLLQLQQALIGADYFSVVDVEPDLAGKHDGIVDVDVKLQPAKRSIYTGGPFIGSDTGLGVQGGIQRRWVNNEGHKWNIHTAVAQRLTTLRSFYTIPLPQSATRAWNFGANYRDADTDTSQSKTLELVGNQTLLWHGWLVTAGLHALSGTFTVGKRGGEPDDAPGVEHGNSTLVYPEISLVKKHGDNPTFVRHGWSLTVAARSTVGKLLSDTDFRQLTADAKWIDAFSRRNRLLLRASAGITKVSDFSALPPQLRFFAGGSVSNRGYGYQALGPRNAHGRVIGGSKLLVVGATIEHYFSRHWGMAAFVDAGNAFNGSDFRPRIGAGLGLRWLSPVGMVRLDLGTPIHNDHHSGIQLNIVIGPDL